jgi:spectrin beta
MTTDISVGVRWDPLNGQEGNGHQNGEEFDFEYDGGNSSSRLFERSRIRALAGEISFRS